MALEKIFENKIKNYLTKQGAWFVKYWGGGEFTKSGIPDILVCYQGKFIGVEVKSDKGKPSELQKHHLMEIHKAGGYGILLYPKDFQKFKDVVECLDEGLPKLSEVLYHDLMKPFWDKWGVDYG